jgi:pantoate--beta-alanine ligase
MQSGSLTMIVSSSINEVRKVRKQDEKLTWGFVPTMGYLHAGHLSLAKRARNENDYVATSIYVNPTQFAPGEDLNSYPRALDRDLELLEAEGVDLVFTPTDSMMYPPGFQTYVTVTEITKLLEGSSRPTHFQGVTTIVAKLFNIVQPTRAYFGQKDAQQAIVLQQMVSDLNFDIELVICPIVREADGLAQSSRNKYLNADQRAGANVLYRALLKAQSAYQNGERNGEILRQIMRSTIDQENLATVDYVSVADPKTLVELDEIPGKALFSMAVFFDKTRLIDNLLVGSRSTGS